MRTVIVVLFLAISLVMFSLPVFAQDTAKMDPKMHEQMMQAPEGKAAAMGDDEMMMRHGKMKKGMCPMHEMMMKSFAGKVMTATNDGGVVVLIGNRLMKFDKTLGLIKEVEIKQDMEGMQKMMMQMCENCPMCRKMKDGCMKQGLKEKPAEAEMKAN
ncbi:MAG: hypothetical protein WC695_10625 [Candidatus Omnitrophota bacterium]